MPAALLFIVLVKEMQGNRNCGDSLNVHPLILYVPPEEEGVLKSGTPLAVVSIQHQVNNLLIDGVLAGSVSDQ